MCDLDSASSKLQSWGWVPLFPGQPHELGRPDRVKAYQVEAPGFPFDSCSLSPPPFSFFILTHFWAKLLNLFPS